MLAVQVPLAAFETGALYDALRVAGIVAGAYIAVMWIAVVLWVYRDIGSRSVSRAVQAGGTLLVAVLNVPGFLLYLAMRPPETLAEAYNRQLEAEAFLHEIEAAGSCPRCRRAIHDSFVACPYCGATIQTACAACSRYLKPAWVVCPYCTRDREAAEAERVRVAAAEAAAQYVPEVTARVPATRVAS